MAGALCAGAPREDAAVENCQHGFRGRQPPGSAALAPLLKGSSLDRETVSKLYAKRKTGRHGNARRSWFAQGGSPKPFLCRPVGSGSPGTSIASCKMQSIWQVFPAVRGPQSLEYAITAYSVPSTRYSVLGNPKSRDCRPWFAALETAHTAQGRPHHAVGKKLNKWYAPGLPGSRSGQLPDPFYPHYRKRPSLCQRTLLTASRSGPPARPGAARAARCRPES